MEPYELDLRNIVPEVKKTAASVLPYNHKEIIGIINGKVLYFPSSFHAARVLKVKNVKTFARNIQKVCHGERKTLKGIAWFFASDTEKYKDLLK
jgi:hypothetical protein